MIPAGIGDDKGAEDRGRRPVGIEPPDRAARQPLVGAAAGQDRHLGAVMMVIAFGLGIEAPDLDAAAAIAGKRQELAGGRNLKNAPAARLEHRLGRALLPDFGGAAQRRKRNDLTHHSPCRHNA